MPLPLDFGTGIGHNTIMIKPTSPVLEMDYNKAMNDAIKMAEKITKMLKSFKKKIDDDQEKIDWGTVGSLNYHKEQLKEVIESMQTIN